MSLKNKPQRRRGMGREDKINLFLKWSPPLSLPSKRQAPLFLDKLGSFVMSRWRRRLSFLSFLRIRTNARLAETGVLWSELRD
jgi:hypothetical protein